MLLFVLVYMMLNCQIMCLYICVYMCGSWGQVPSWLVQPESAMSGYRQSSILD